MENEVEQKPEDVIGYWQSYGSKGFFKHTSCPPGGNLEIGVVSNNVRKDTKYPIKGLDYCMRFMLEDGRAWDCSSGPVVSEVMKALYPAGSKVPVPCTIRITRTDSSRPGRSPYTIEKVKA